MPINRTFFYDHVRHHLFGGKLAPAQVAGMTAVLDMWDHALPGDDVRWLAYMLATAYHETDRKMQPIKEYGTETYFNKRYGPPPLGQNAGLALGLGNTRPGDGTRFAGRGFVQLTGRGHYTAWSQRLGLDLVGNPDLALTLAPALRILDHGMVHGLFTGRKLAHYFNARTEDWKGARRIINGTDKAEIIAGYGKAFYAAISHVP